MSAKQAQPHSQGSLLPVPAEREPGDEVEASEGPARQIISTSTQHKAHIICRRNDSDRHSVYQALS